MNYEQFAIWLHGFLEISNAETINKEQTQIIKDHLALLFEKKTPDRQKKEEETDMEKIQKHIKRLQEEMRKNRIDHDDYPSPPPYNPVPMPQQPAYPHWQWVPPEPVYCKDTTASPLPDLGTTVSKANPCQETPIGEQFVGVDMKFDTEAHKTKKYC